MTTRIVIIQIFREIIFPVLGLLSILMQEPTVRCLTATANLCTITHIAVLAVSYFASFVKELKEFGLLKVFFRIFNFVKPYISL